MNKNYLKQELYKKTGSKHIMEACYKAENDTGIKWKSIYDFVQGRSIPRIESLIILRNYLQLDLNKTIL